jgi:hypothetical protein
MSRLAFARHPRESGGPWTLILTHMTSRDSRFRGNDGIIFAELRA